MSTDMQDRRDENGDHKDTKDTKDDKERANELSHLVIGAAIEVHRLVGPGLLESAYEECLAHELSLQGLAVSRQVPVPLSYKGVTLGCAYKLDMLVERILLVEIKAVQHLDPVHTAQVLTYLRMQNLWLGLLINFHAPVLKNGIKRVVLD
jgi:GxxExxY protein